MPDAISPSGNKFLQFIGEICKAVDNISNAVENHISGTIIDKVGLINTPVRLTSFVNKSKAKVAIVLFAAGSIYNLSSNPMHVLAGTVIGIFASTTRIPFKLNLLQEGELLGRVSKGDYVAPKIMLILAAWNYCSQKSFTDNLIINLSSGILVGNSLFHRSPKKTQVNLFVIRIKDWATTFFQSATKRIASAPFFNRVKARRIEIAMTLFAAGGIYNLYATPMRFLVGTIVGIFSSASPFLFKLYSLQEVELLGRVSEGEYDAPKAMLSLFIWNYCFEKSFIDAIIIGISSGVLVGNSCFHRSLKNPQLRRLIAQVGEMIANCFEANFL